MGYHLHKQIVPAYSMPPGAHARCAKCLKHVNVMFKITFKYYATDARHAHFKKQLQFVYKDGIIEVYY